jgi:O-succinylbenzoate synthase
VKIARAEVFRYEMPLAAPLPLAHGILERRAGLLLKLTTDDGRFGWGEAAPLPGFSAESLDEAASALLARARSLAGKTLSEDALPDEDFAGPCPASVSFALASAALALSNDINGAVPLNALLAGDPAQILERARDLAAEGYRCAKLKVGQATPAVDAELVCGVREALGVSVALRLDANRAWSFSEALDFAERIKGCAIAYIEEPLADPAQLLAFHEKTGLPYALDETFVARDASNEIFEGAAACIWKPTLLHFPGIGERLRTNDYVVPVQQLVLSAAFESGVGIAALARYAAAYGCPETPIGLDTYSWLAEDVLEARLAIFGGTVEVGTCADSARRVEESKLARVL